MVEITGQAEIAQVEQGCWEWDHALWLGELHRLGEVPAGKGYSGEDRLHGQGFMAQLGGRERLRGPTGSEVVQTGKGMGSSPHVQLLWTKQ